VIQLRRARSRDHERLLGDLELDRGAQALGIGLGLCGLRGRHMRLDSGDRQVEFESWRRIEGAGLLERGGDGGGRVREAPAGPRLDLVSLVVGQAYRRLDRVRGERRGICADASRERLGIDRDPRRQRHATPRRPGIPDDAIDGVARSTDRHGVSDHRGDVGPAPDIGVADRAGSLGALDHDLSRAEAAVGRSELPGRGRGIEAGQVHRTDADTRQDAAGIVEVVGVQRAGPDGHRREQPDEECHQEPQPARRAERLRADGNGVRSSRGHGSDIPSSPSRAR
jgi:hypothetical protein